MGEANTFLMKKKVKLIRNIFKEEFEKQEKNIGNLTSENFKITMEEIRKSQDKIKNLGKKYVILEVVSNSPRTCQRRRLKNLKNDVKTWRQNYRSFTITK